MAVQDLERQASEEPKASACFRASAFLGDKRMEISAFQLHEDRCTEEYTIASVIVTTGVLWWKKSKRREVFKKTYGIHWRFAATGDFTPDEKVENLYLAYMCFKETGRLKNDR